MDAVELGRFLEGHRLCLLATTSSRGEPQIRPVRFTVDGCAFWIASGSSQRVRNLVTNPSASLAVLDGEGRKHRFLLAEGTIVTHSSASHALRQLWNSRHGGDAGSFATAWLELTPSRLFTYRP
jgi:general stress protein 26